MRAPPDPPRRQHIPWHSLLLTASLVTFWNRPTTAQLTMESVPFHAAKGKDVLLLVHNLPENLLAYHWYKGQVVSSNQRIVSYVTGTQVNTPGPANSGRETLFLNGSLLFQNVSLEDTGYYTLEIIDADVSTDQVTGQFQVYPELPKPSITSNNSHPVEDEDSVALTCEPETQDTTYVWWINGQRLQVSPRLDLSLDNRTLTLLSVTRNDTGPYECETQNPVSTSRSDAFTLNISYGPDTPTISPPDSSYHPGANLSLFCYAASNPPAQYSWLINGRPQQSTQELIIPNITVNDSGSYTCLAYNSATGLNRTTVKTITVSDDPVQRSSPGLSAGAIAGIVIGVLAGVALMAALVYFLYFRKTGGASDQSDLTEHKPSASNHSQGHSDNSPYKMDEVVYSSLNFNAWQPTQPTSASSSQTATETVYSEVKRK
ncbi:carcinoembryonic antigen-related cell adhesion molecule 6-like isoform X3 [Cynocephalus volans]|uniref:carcinoembryonic antigen-related cell adhesion molecule 6-like isoform X3 n=1 Tax=Cynocephalus volans TaxID=110931 RepID=UPI002FCAF02B